MATILFYVFLFIFNPTQNSDKIAKKSILDKYPVFVTKRKIYYSLEAPIGEIYIRKNGSNIIYCIQIKAVTKEIDIAVLVKGKNTETYYKSLKEIIQKQKGDDYSRLLMQKISGN